MTIQVVTSAGAGSKALSNSVRTRYTDAYEEMFWYSRLYDQLASEPGQKPMSELHHGSSVQFQFLSHMAPGSSAISEVADITPQALVDATASATPISRGEALQASEALFLRNFTSYPEKWAAEVGENAAESVDALARNAATQGSIVKRAAARASLDAGTTGHRLSAARFYQAQAQIADLKCPTFLSPDGSNQGKWAAIMSPMAYHDFRAEASGDVLDVGKYQRAEIVLNWEIGMFGPFRLIVSPWAKIFYFAGAANGTAVATTSAAVVSRLGTTITAAASTNLNSIEASWVGIGTEETANTHQLDNERVWLNTFTGSTLSIVGQGPNGGFRYGHASGVAIDNSDSVHTVVLGGPESLASIYATEVGRFGQLVGPKRDGILDQFITLGFKWYGVYARVAENRVVRLEVSASDDA